jgi:hypothetical protein
MFSELAPFLHQDPPALCPIRGHIAHPQRPADRVGMFRQLCACAVTKAGERPLYSCGLFRDLNATTFTHQDR